MNNSLTPRPKAHILLVEDAPVLREVLAMALEDEGYELVCAGNGQEGLKGLKHKRPDLIITDYRMPCMDGVAMISQIRADPAHAAMPILLFSANSLADIPGAEQATAFVQKGAPLEDLLFSIAQLLQPQQLSHQEGALHRLLPLQALARLRQRSEEHRALLSA